MPPRLKFRSKYEERVARQLTRLGYDYRHHVSFNTDSNARIQVDFIVNRLGIVLEVDGPEHAHKHAQMYDRWRDTYLQSLGYRTARVAHYDLDTYEDAVMNALADAQGEQTEDTFIDREDYYRFLRVYHAFCESIEYLIPGRLDSVQITIQGRNSSGRSTNWILGLPLNKEE